MYSEEELEEGTLDWFEEIGYNTAFGPDISPDDFDFFSKAIVSELRYNFNIYSYKKIRKGDIYSNISL